MAAARRMALFARSSLTRTPPSTIRPDRSLSSTSSRKADLKLADKAEELAKVLKEPLSEASSARAETLVKDLLAFNQKALAQEKMAEVAKVAEELAKVLKEPPSPGTKARSQALFKDLLTSHKKAPAEVDAENICLLAEKVHKIVKDGPPETAIVMIRPILKELAGIVLPQVQVTDEQVNK